MASADNGGAVDTLESPSKAAGRPHTDCGRRVTIDTSPVDPPRRGSRKEWRESAKSSLITNKRLSFLSPFSDESANVQRAVGDKRITSNSRIMRRQQHRASDSVKSVTEVSYSMQSVSNDVVAVSRTMSARAVKQNATIDAPLCSFLQKSSLDVKSPAVCSTSTDRSPTFDDSDSISLKTHHSSLGHKLRKVFFSLHCCALTPLIVILVTVYIVTTVVTFTSSRDSSYDAFLSLHDVVVAKMKVSISRLTLGKMKRMTVATGSMYFSNNTFSNPTTDRLMPLENGMVLRLCAELRDMDSRKRVSSLGAVSLTRHQAAVCALSHERPGYFIGVQSRSGAIRYYNHIDPMTLEIEKSLMPLPLLSDLSIAAFTSYQRFDTVINIWNDTLKKGEMMKPSQYWVKPHQTPTYMAFVYPFFETYANGSSGVGYLFATMFTGDLTGIQGYNETNSGIRVMLVDPNLTARRLLVLANSWGQPLSNVTNVWWSLMKGEKVEFMHIDDVADHLMRTALEHIDVRAAINKDRGHNISFLYKGFDALVTTEHIFTESGVDFLLVVATSRSYYLGPEVALNATIIAIGIISLLAVIAACIAFVEYCLFLPLRSIRSELKLALSGAPVTYKKPYCSVLHEVNELGDVCITLRRRLDDVRSFMPHRLIAENVTAKPNSVLAEELAYDVNYNYSHPGNKLKHVACSVAYVYYSSQTTLNPTNAVVEQVMQTVVGIANECGGCFEVQRPDYCVISFGVRSKRNEFNYDAAWAVKFALQLREKLDSSAEIAGLYRVIVESGMFLSGIISGDDRSHFVLLCRNLHHLIGDFLLEAGVVAAVTEETAVLVRGRYRLLPFETVYLERNHEEFVKLHEVLDGDASTPLWNRYEKCYSRAYDMMVCGDYSGALMWWDEVDALEQEILAVERLFCKSTQAMRLQHECITRARAGNTTPFVCRPQNVSLDDTDISCSIGILSGGGSEDITVGTTSSTVSLQHGSGAAVNFACYSTTICEPKAVCLPAQIRDQLGNVWRPSLKPIENSSTDLTSVYMAISATGTLAVLNVYQLKESAAHLPREDVERALQELQDLDANETLVQYLSYCYLSSRQVVLVTQYVPGSTLRELKIRYGRQLPLIVVKRNVASILRALVHLHSRGLVHGRLSPENVMVGVRGRCRVKGMLLGAAPLIVHHDSFYMSPEVAAGGAWTMENDIYAFGLLLLAMLTDRHPWRWVPHVEVNRSQNELSVLLSDINAFRKALQAEQLEPVPPPDDVDDTLREVLSACLCSSPECRLTAEEILDIYDL